MNVIVKLCREPHITSAIGAVHLVHVCVDENRINV